jgi:hypothetical protein
MHGSKLKIVFSITLMVLNLLAVQSVTAMAADTAPPSTTASTMMTCHDLTTANDSARQGHSHIHEHGCCKAGGCSCPALSAVAMAFTLPLQVHFPAVDENIVGAFREHRSRDTGLLFKPPI